MKKSKLKLTPHVKFHILEVMYIPYEDIGKVLFEVLRNEKLREFFYNKKVSQNVMYIEKNKHKVLKKLKLKLKNNEKLRLVFYVYDETKWKCKSLYDQLLNDYRFDIKVLVTKNSVTNKTNPNYQTDEELQKTYKFFKERGLNVEYAYDLSKSKHIPLEEFEPDIIIYQHPWYVKTEQGPVVCSRFALTAYIPYYFQIEAANIDCGLRFHKYIESYYILDNRIKNKYSAMQPDIAHKLKVVGYPFLDYFLDNNSDEEGYVIYAPHWTVTDKGLAYGTFKWSGRFMLEYAKAHPEIKWIFKPHPLLYKALIDFGLMTAQEADSYYFEWAKLGIKYENGDYLPLFSKSKMMITDCSSFLGEYLATGKPLIHLMSEKSQFNNSDNPILQAYYRANNLDELKHLLEILPQEDFMKQQRFSIAKSAGVRDINASQNIVKDILDTILGS